MSLSEPSRDGDLCFGADWWLARFSAQRGRDFISIGARGMPRVGGEVGYGVLRRFCRERSAGSGPMKIDGRSWQECSYCCSVAGVFSHLRKLASRGLARWCIIVRGRPIICRLGVNFRKSVKNENCPTVVRIFIIERCVSIILCILAAKKFI